MNQCPLCGAALVACGSPFSNHKVNQNAPTKVYPRIDLLLDNLRSTLNVGSIFRSADGAGVSHIYCCGTTPTPEHPKIMKTGLGAESFVPWTYHRNSLDVISNLKSTQIVCALEASPNSIPLFGFNNSDISQTPVLLIVGNEISGVDPELLERSQFTFALPMLGGKTSLNVAVATGIAIYALRFCITNNAKIKQNINQ